MLLKSKRFIFVGALVCMSHLFAATENKLLTCPSAGAIQEGGLTESIPFFQKNFMAYNLSSYDTSFDWVFVMGPIAAKSAENALDKGRRLLTTVSGDPLPQKNGSEWACLYQTKNPKVLAAAIYSEKGVSVFTLRNALNRF